MTTFTLCYSGTDCFLDQSLVLREPREMASYNTYSGYIPSKVHKLITDTHPVRNLSATMNGCGGPYATDRTLLPVRVWSIEGGPNIDDWAQCHLAPAFSNDSITGQSLEIISIAGIARMLGVTLHIVHAGGLNQLLDSDWSPQHTLGFTRESLRYPIGDSGMWNNSGISTAGNYCLRWSEEDNTVISEFIEVFNRVVLLGHSRGGVSCIIAANYLAEWFAPLEIKICALDPVPGSGSWWPALTHIPGAKTTEYIGIYAIDETSSGFNGVVPRVKAEQDDSLTIWDPLSANSEKIPDSVWNSNNYKLIYTRGRHATVPGSRSAQGNGETDPNDDNVGASGNLANAYVIEKLIDWGVPLTTTNREEIFTWVTMMNNYSAHFASMRNSNYGPIKVLGKMNGWYYYNARGISSTDGKNPSSWMYLEAFVKIAEGQNAEDVNTQRGLIDMGVRSKYYAKLGGSGKVHPWVYLADACSE